MRRGKSFLPVAGIAVILAATSSTWANNAPVVSNATATQRGDASKLVDIHYSLTDADGDTCTVWVVASDNGGTTWRVPIRTLSGDLGAQISPGSNKTIVWDAGKDMPGKVGSFRIRIYADDGKGNEATVLVPAGWFPYQNVSGTENWVFVDSFRMDKYEVTNQFYCQYLNSADPSGAHWDTGMEIDRLGDSGNYYYTVHEGRDYYPIRYVSYNDAVAFAAWRSNLEGVTYRLPTEEEWEKAAAWDPVAQRYYIYGFHRDSIDCDWCVYNGSSCGNSGPRVVGYFNGTSGRNNAKSYYGCYDMSGNLYEWTSGLISTNRVFRGGDWSGNATYCQCTYRHGSGAPTNRSNHLGFRLVLDSD